MLSFRHRFHGYNSLRGVYERGQTSRGQLVSLRYEQRQNKLNYRVAVVVSRKVNKSAVVRNRLRRRVYERVRLMSDLIPPGSDLVFTVYGDQLLDLSPEQLTDTIKKLIRV